MKYILFSLLLLFGNVLFGQKNFPVNGVLDENDKYYAFVDVNIYVDHKTLIKDAILVVKNDKVFNVGADVQIPKEAIVINIPGKYIYPSFIDLYTSYGVSNKVKEVKKKTLGAKGWNDAIKSEYSALSEFSVTESEAKKMRKWGFGTVVSHKMDGIVRGTSLVSTLGAAKENLLVLKNNATLHFSFKKGSSKNAYPNSLMGAVALLRQTYFDSEWYASQLNTAQFNQSLEAFNSYKVLPKVFETDNKYQIFLANNIAKEFNTKYIIKTNGDEYQRVNDLQKLDLELIVPINFPKKEKVDNPMDALDIPLAKLKHWEMAPSNPGILDKNDIEFSITSHGIKSTDSFLKNIRKAVSYGLSKEVALKALTSVPAKLVSVDHKVGDLRKGKLANFIITSGDIFTKGTKIYENWVQGKKYVISTIDSANLAGTYNLVINDSTHQLKVSGKPGKYNFEIHEKDSTKRKLKSKIEGNNIQLTLRSKIDSSLFIRLSGIVGKQKFEGAGKLSNGEWVSWSASLIKSLTDTVKTDSLKKQKVDIGYTIFPFTEYGWKEKPKRQNLLFKNATVWTSEKEGVLKNTDVLIIDGKIREIGKDLKNSNAQIVNASGMHLTAGIVDEHSHTALFSVNESGQANTAEVRMYDVINPEDINIYRQLSGGVTTAQLLHGSANPIGGQSAIVKYRWGNNTECLKISYAKDFIKFALGENVKQSNWGDNYKTRFPQTRMGVEQTYEDAFTRTKKYIQDWEIYKKNKKSNNKPRKDLELEAIKEILDGKRHITCHSYVQSEVNMLIKVAERFGFKINTFTHILEGYKVADKMARHGANGSTFSDWWAYKYEVREAIPYNAALMKLAGVNVAVNSDDNEMARRLNHEAAKSIKYGGITEHEAWKMVTINPAKMLYLDKYIGSIKVGKDADLVLWNKNPLSVYAKAEKTIIEGVVYFDREKDKELRKEILQERNRIINKMMNQND